MKLSANPLQGLPVHLHDPWYRFGRIFEECERFSLSARNQRVLDLGCAQGFLEKLLIDRWQCKVEGWDSRDYRWADQRIDDWRFEMCDISQPWPKREPFDAIFAFEVIEHMIDTDRFLERCRVNLTSKGRLYLSTPNLVCLQNRLKVLAGMYPCMMEYRNVIHHVRLYTVPTLLHHLRVHGFKPVLCKGVNLLPIRAHKSWLLDKISSRLAGEFPSLCSQVFVVAEAIE